MHPNYLRSLNPLAIIEWFLILVINRKTCWGYLKSCLKHITVYEYIMVRMSLNKSLQVVKGLEENVGSFKVACVVKIKLFFYGLILL